MPQSRYRTGELLSRLVRHWVIFALPAALLALLVASIDLEWLPKHGLGLVLYRTHDGLFLPFKGYTFTLFHPWSWVWWGLLAFLLGLGLLSWLLDIQIVKRLHVRLVRWVVRRHSLHGPLLQRVRLYGRLGLQSSLVRVTADCEWQHSMLKLTRSRGGSADLRLYQSVASLTCLCLDLARTLPADQQEAWRAREHWCRAMLALHALHASAVVVDKEAAVADKEKVASFYALMKGLLFAVDLPPKPKESHDSRKSAPEPLRTFTGMVLADLHVLVDLGQQKWDAKPSETQPAPILLAQLVRSCESRRRLLHDLCLHLEADMRAPEFAWAGTREGFPDAGKAEECWPVAGQLASSIALHASLWTDEPWVGGAFLNSVCALRLLLQATAEHSNAIEDWKELIRDIPTALDYQLLTRWMERRLLQDQQAWQSELSQAESLVEEGDFELAWSAVESMERAIGPT